MRTSVRVTANPETITTEQTSPQPHHATSEDIQSSAGTYRDLSRYLQLFPGVVSNSDISDDILVRGGNPMENLYLVDGIEIPNINHIATEGTTGGLMSMIDTSAVESLDLLSGAYDASYSERLSSVVDIHTRELADRRAHIEGDVGFIGAGGVALVPLPHCGSLVGSAHRSLLNLVTNDIGLNGVPIYSNLFLLARLYPSNRDEVTLLSLSGVDSINITPTAVDPWETSTIQMQYSGWRSTNGIRWRHIFSENFYGILTVSEAEKQESIHQQDQFYGVVHPTSLAEIPLTPVYSELNHDGRATLKYDVGYQPRSWLTVIVGGAGMLNRVNYNVVQPKGEPSPLTLDPTASDATSFAPNFLSGETGSYAEATVQPTKRWSISGGGRLQTFALGGHITATPRLYSALRFSEHTGLHAGYGQYAQMPPAIYITSWQQNRDLSPMRVRHVVVGADLYSGAHARFAAEAYQKNYVDYPVSSQYPSFSMASNVDALGMEFLWIPLTSQGTGVASGVEVSGDARIGSHLSGQANIAYARAKFAGLDGVLHAGNFDFPVVGNVAGTYRSNKHYEGSWRYAYTTGRPYTPFLLAASAQQNRPIYDMRRINALRGPVYSRFDFEFNRSFDFGARKLILYGGLDNAWNRQNFLGYFWMPRADAAGVCSADPSKCVSEQHEMVRFPDFGVRFLF